MISTRRAASAAQQGRSAATRTAPTTRRTGRIASMCGHQGRSHRSATPAHPESHSLRYRLITVASRPGETGTGAATSVAHVVITRLISPSPAMSYQGDTDCMTTNRPNILSAADDSRTRPEPELPGVHHSTAHLEKLGHALPEGGRKPRAPQHAQAGAHLTPAQSRAGAPPRTPDTCCTAATNKPYRSAPARAGGPRRTMTGEGALDLRAGPHAYRAAPPGRGSLQASRGPAPPCCPSPPKGALRSAVSSDDRGRDPRKACPGPHPHPLPAAGSPRG